MKNYPYPYPWKGLPGTVEEMRFLTARFETMSVRERNLLEGASRLQSIENAADMINLTEQLHCFFYYHGATNEGKLGRYFAEYREKVSPDQMSFLNLEHWGRDLREQHGGVFVSGGFVEQISPCTQVYNGKNLDRLSGGEAAVQLKLASSHCPDGIWLTLPDYKINTGEPDEMAVAMDELGITGWDQAVLLEAKCCLGNISDLSEQYGALEQLIRDGNNLGYVLDERGQGMPCFEERFKAAMELEDCTRLNHALDISQNLGCYDFIPETAQWEQYGRYLADKDGMVNQNSAASRYFDYSAYCALEVGRLGLQACSYGFIARNDREFLYEFSTPPRQGPELTM